MAKRRALGRPVGCGTPTAASSAADAKQRPIWGSEASAQTSIEARPGVVSSGNRQYMVSERKAGPPSTCLLKDSSGQAMAEFAIALPLFALIVFAIVELTSLYHHRFVVSYAGFMAARCAAVHYRDANAVAQSAAKTIVGGALDGRVLVPVVGAVLMKTSTQLTPGSVRVDVTYTKQVSSPVIARALSPLGRLTGIHLIKLRSIVELPRLGGA